MTIPMIGNTGFTEVSSSGTLNDKAGAKINLPVQIFKLTENISGNLTLNNNSNHKKIILDTNGKTILNSAGAPLTTNSSTTLELQGAGNIQSTLKTFTSSVSDTSNTGTTTISEADSSTIAITSTDTTTNSFVDKTTANGNSLSLTTSNSPISSNGNQLAAGFFLNSSELASVFQSGSGFASGILFTGTSARSTTTPPDQSGGTATLSFPLTIGATASISSVGGFGSILQQNGSSGVANQILIFKPASEASNDENDSGSHNSLGLRAHFRITVSGANRILTFTNNLAVSVVLSGDDPYDDVTVSAGATAVVTRTGSTDGSFSLTGTISGSDGSSQPFALAVVNSGTGSLNTDDYSGTFSASGL